MSGDCIFCRMVKDRSLVPYSIAESERAFAFLENRPLRRGHSLVIPKTHATDLFDVSPEDLQAVIELSREVARRLRRRLGASGENLLIASGPGSEQSVFHLHTHVVPRLPNDDLRWNDWWQTKVLSVTLPELASLAATLRE